jgi:hypothetical protein
VARGTQSLKVLLIKGRTALPYRNDVGNDRSLGQSSLSVTLLAEWMLDKEVPSELLPFMAYVELDRKSVV